MKHKPLAYFSLDVETLGTIAGIHPLLSIGAVVMDIDEKILSSFEHNLSIPYNLYIEKEVANWWSDPSRSEAWTYCNEGSCPSETVMDWFIQWHDKAAETFDLQYLGKPTVFDYSFIQYYCQRFCGRPLLKKARAIDIHSLVVALTGSPIAEVKSEFLPVQLLAGLKDQQGHEHTALYDAISQGIVGIRCLKLFARIRDIVNLTKLGVV